MTLTALMHAGGMGLWCDWLRRLPPSSSCHPGPTLPPLRAVRPVPLRRPGAPRPRPSSTPPTAPSTPRSICGSRRPLVRPKAAARRAGRTGAVSCRRQGRLMQEGSGHCCRAASGAAGLRGAGSAAAVGPAVLRWPPPSGARRPVLASGAGRGRVRPGKARLSGRRRGRLWPSLRPLCCTRGADPWGPGGNPRNGVHGDR